MSAISGTAIFWFVAQGMVIGWIFGKVVRHEGVTLNANVLWGILASVLTGSMGILMGHGDGLIFALAGTLAILFLVNVFHHHHVEEIYGHVNRDIRLKK